MINEKNISWIYKSLKIVYYPLLSFLCFFIYLIPQKREYWIFGSWFGEQYSDNSKVLFEYISDKDSPVRPIWITRERQVVATVRGRGYEAYLLNSVRGIWFSLLAGTAIICQSKRDISNVLLTGKMVLNLYHGIPMKKIGFDHNSNAGMHYNLYLSIKKYFFPFAYESYTKTVASSKFVQKIMTSAFRLDKEDVIISGSPRSDIILSKTGEFDIPDILHNSSKEGRKNLFFAPTYRDHEDRFIKLFHEREDVLLNFNKTLVDNNARFFIKPHYANKHLIGEIEKYISYSNIRVISYEQLPDVSYFLPFVDILITDFSGIYFDYLLLDRPIIFTTFDFDYYTQDERELYEDYLTATSCGERVDSWYELTVKIKNILNGEDNKRNDRKKAIKKYHYYNDNNNCERIYKTLLTLYK